METALQHFLEEGLAPSPGECISLVIFLKDTSQRGLDIRRFGSATAAFISDYNDTRRLDRYKSFAASFKLAPFSVSVEKVTFIVSFLGSQALAVSMTE